MLPSQCTYGVPVYNKVIRMRQLVKIFYDKEKMEKNIEKTTIKIQ